MTEGSNTGTDNKPEASLDAALTDALRTAPLDPGALDRMRAAVAQEWAIAVKVRGNGGIRSWYRWGFALAAAAGVVVIAYELVVARPSVSAETIGSVARLDHGDVKVRSGWHRNRALHAGDPLRVGDVLTTHGPVLVALSRGGSLRIGASSAVEVTGPTEVFLARGLVYVDTPANPTGTDRVRVRTHAGVVEHLGTEFEVLSDGQTVRVRVREGRIRLVRSASTTVVSAGTEVLAGPSGPASQRPVDTFGRDWLWATALAPDYEIEGRSLIEFLEWVSRELGRHLEFVDPRAREVAIRTILHGSVRGREPLAALDSVLATTTLTYEIRGAGIRVHSGP